MTDGSFTIRPTTLDDMGLVRAHMIARWGAETAVAHGKLYRPAELPGFIALDRDEWAGLLTYHIVGRGCEIVTIDSDRSGLGIGTALIEAAKTAALAAGCARLWLVTTNDNWPAIRFYQKRGFHLAALRLNAVEESRKLKPEIPLTGVDGIAIRDELEFEMLLAGKDEVLTYANG